MAFDQDEAVRRLDEPLATEVALDTAARQLPDARSDGQGAGAGDPRLEAGLHRRVEVGLPDFPAGLVEQPDDAVGPGDDQARAVLRKAQQRWTADVDSHGRARLGEQG